MVDNMSQNEFRFISNQGVRRKGRKLIDTQNVLLASHKQMQAQLDSLIKKMVESKRGYHQVKQVYRAMTYDYCGEGHENNQCNLGGYIEEEAKFIISLFSSTYTPIWINHPNFRWNDNHGQGSNQAQQHHNRYHN